MADFDIYPDRNSRETRKVQVSSAPTAADVARLGLYPGDLFWKDSTGEGWRVRQDFGVVQQGGAAAVSGPSAEDVIVTDQALTSTTYAALFRDGSSNQLKITLTAPAAGFAIVTFNCSFMRHNGAGGIMNMFFQLVADSVAVPDSDTGVQLAGFGLMGSVSFTRKVAVAAAGGHTYNINYRVMNNAAPDCRLDITAALPHTECTLTGFYLGS